MLIKQYYQTEICTELYYNSAHLMILRATTL